MQAFQKTIDNIREQLRTLSPTARLLVGALVVILAMTLFMVAQYSSRASLEPLGLKANLTADARARAINHIQSRGIPYRERGNEILVPPDQRISLIAQLTDSDVITPEQINFDSLIEKDSPFLSKSQNDRRWLIASMNVLSRTVSSMSGIQRATVVIHEPQNPGGIGRSHIPASASVMVVTRAGEPLTQQKVDAIAALVAGAHANLKPDNVEVVDATGRRHRARADDAHNASANFELQQTKERVAREKINETLSYIPGVKVAVSATMDTREIIQQKRSFDEPRLGVTGESSRLTSSSNQTLGREAGVRPNTGAAITGGGGRGSSMTDERTEASMIPAFGGTDARITDARGLALQINATIGVPRSYFVRLFQNEAGDEAAQPNPDALAALITEETARIRAQIEPLIDTRAVDGATAGAVVVSMIPDFALTTLMPGGGASAEAGGFMTAMGDGWVQYAGLGALAMVSLAMMFMLVRKASVAQGIPTPSELRGTPALLDADDVDVLGEANETTSSMEGLEIDEVDLRRQQMLVQVNEMAKTSPAEAASLIRRWVRAEV